MDRPPAETIELALLDRFAQAEQWGQGSNGGAPVLRTLTLRARCPRCGGPQATQRWSQPMPEDGYFPIADRWTNPCGHVDTYALVLIEAGTWHPDARLTNPASGASGRSYRDYFGLTDKDVAAFRAATTSAIPPDRVHG